MDKTARTIGSYNQCAARFNELYHDNGGYQDFIQKFSDFLTERAVILDLGCGPGNVSKFLSQQGKGYQIIGVDLSTGMLEIAKRNVPEQTFMVGDIRYLEFKRQFDGIIASFSIIHLDTVETTKLFGDCYNLLKDGGYFYISFMADGCSGFETTNFSDNEIYFNYLIPEEIVNVLENTGYQIIEKYFRSYYRMTEKVVRDVIVIAKK